MTVTTTTPDPTAGGTTDGDLWAYTTTRPRGTTFACESRAEAQAHADAINREEPVQPVAHYSRARAVVSIWPGTAAEHAQALAHAADARKTVDHELRDFLSAEATA